MRTSAERLQWARKRAGYETATEAARAFGWTVSTYLGHENGDRNPSRAASKRYGTAFKVRWEWLLEGEGQPSLRGLKAPVLGYVGAGANITPIDDFPQGEALDEVDLPHGAPVEAVAVIARGDSMYPRYFDGERLFYVKTAISPLELIGRECIIKLRDGRMMVKILRRGRGKKFNLESWNAPTLEDAEVEWAAPVKWRG